MASPNWDALSVKLAKRIADPAAGGVATGDGARFTSALRDQYLNEAIRRLMRKYVRRTQPDVSEIKLIEPAFFYGGYLSDYAGSLAANVVALTTINSGGIFGIVSVQNTNVTNNSMVKPLPHTEKADAVAGDNRYLAAAAVGHEYYLIEGTNLRVIGSGATDAISVQFVKAHADLSAGGSTDILVPAAYWDQVVDMAYKVAKEENGDDNSLQLGIIKEAVIDKYING